jgi:outer membrane protein OmpA-like peptidoglycan-associated protein
VKNPRGNANRSGPGVVAAVLAAVVVAAAGCATAPPVELIDARTAYDRASFGPAAQLAPADLRKARVALDEAERALSEERNLAKAVDFAYVAGRTVQIAEAHAETALTERKMATQAAGTLSTARAQLATARRGEAEQAEQVGVERTAREAAEHKADASEQKAGVFEEKAAASEHKAAASEEKAQQANDALSRLSAKAEPRGLVITLSGSVLFRSNGTDLLPAAQRRLDEVASVLVAQGQNVAVEGYTDSSGSAWSNVDLSRRRAEAVRAYLVSRGCATDRIVARGLGPDRPVADNASGKGRADNRRVEIVINRP